MNFNKNLISLMAIALFQISISQSMEEKATSGQKNHKSLSLVKNNRQSKIKCDLESITELLDPSITPRHVTPVYPNWHVLELELISNRPSIETINRLLGYGAVITKGALELAQSKVNSQELLQLFDLHTRLFIEAKKNPTEGLLRTTITFNKPYFVQIILLNKPKLITLDHLKLAQEKCPAALPHLNKIVKLVRLKKFAKEKAMPNEVIQYIEKIVNKNTDKI